MSLSPAIANAIRNRFAAQVATPEALTVIYDNTTSQSIPTSGRWCRFLVLLGVQQQVSAAGPGQRRFRTAGTALAQVFEPIGGGDGAQLALVAVIQDAFRAVTLDGPPFITFDPPYVSAAPSREDSWWLIPVAIPFRADEYA